MIKYNLRVKRTEKLVELAQSGLMEALELIIERYYPMVVKISSKYYAPWAEFEDIVQNGLIGLIKAVFYFNFEKSSFNSFAWRSIESEIQTFITYLNRRKNKILSESSSIDVFDEEEGTEQADYSLADKESNIIKTAFIQIIKEKITLYLKDIELDIFEMWLDGYSYKEIEKELNINFKKIDNTIQKVKRIGRTKIDKFILDQVFTN
ncbi:RNA polymerase sigma70 factor [Thermosipho melanesiensis]|uniref:RNA polymerase, sigma-24 subunit, ECF subfamily n=2 Tax=Thermosipho melanesiensis TaxID=46541 RepID=A6LJ19_THEM4|nr:sigma-70 family RNA polymerase sigma factor [Thermosipho melanesiensis]ABR29920.1 RNA polymerase, sigma-24 subunit, ECF subfamily [Thermosipho melanesiensis BI429]APT73128.1 RNA polymerase sigma70 factor [Thermosipho melanesiensis]OOC38526.1 RNA polymerase sigma70 factor [Thermosipho melanesiensis]OOC40330.1 RNA polymerase sigma70 factor [Thermosipho melanesiensis]OOC40594.1 RNA polymerase sigma70 factor [Thermosipho melanesiensis]